MAQHYDYSNGYPLGRNIEKDAATERLAHEAIVREEVRQDYRRNELFPLPPDAPDWRRPLAQAIEDAEVDKQTSERILNEQIRGGW